MRHDMNEADYIARLAQRSQEPDIQRLIASFPPLEPDQLAVVSRVMGGTRRRTTIGAETAA
jgi:hypothetical protein